MVNNEQFFSTALASSIHEIKNILNTISHTAESLQVDINNLDKESACKKVSRIQNEISFANTDIVQRLCFYRLNNKQYSLQIEEHLVGDFLQEQFDRLQSITSSNGIQLSLKSDQDLVGFFDEHMVSTVISTATFNALRYAKSTIEISASNKGAFLCLQVKDDGEGFPDSMLEECEDAALPMDSKSGHTGLGLHFSQRWRRNIAIPGIRDTLN